MNSNTNPSDGMSDDCRRTAPEHYWSSLSDDQQAEMRKIGMRFRELVPGIRSDGTVPDGATAAALLEILNIEGELAEEYIYWLQLSNEVLEAFTDWQSRTRRKFERNGWPWTTEELARRSHLWEHE